MTQAAIATMPVSAADRLRTLDVLRGFALLGILLMNIPTFGLPEAAYGKPTIWGGDDLLNRWVNAIVYVLGEGKMRAIFSMMFGASALLLVSRAEERGAGLAGADVYYRRTLWLLLFGMIHGYLIWWGDILFPYALLGLLLFPLRKLSPRALLITAGVQLALLTVGFFFEGYEAKETHQKYQQLLRTDLETTKLTDDQKKELDAGIKQAGDWAKQKEEAEKEVKAYQGNYVENLKKRAASTWKWHRFPIYFPFLWDMMLMMFAGMAFYKLGVLTGARPDSFYWKLALVSAAIALPMNITVAWLEWKNNYSDLAALDYGWTYEPGRVAMALCYVALIILAVKHGVASAITSRLAAVGQMAFSNYISHSLICSVIFYGGYGFGLVGKLERWHLYVIVLAIWTFNLVWSPWWLRRYYFGPLEWVWRSLTYWKKQPWRIEPVPVLAAAGPADVAEGGIAAAVEEVEQR